MRKRKTIKVGQKVIFDPYTMLGSGIRNRNYNGNS